MLMHADGDRDPIQPVKFVAKTDVSGFRALPP